MADTATAPTTELVCGTRAGFERHYRRGEPIDDACRTAKNTYENVRRTRETAARRAEKLERAQRAANLAAEVAARMHRRLEAVARTAPGTLGLGALAGTTVAHEFVPDGGLGTLCRACFGWCNDVRHWGGGRRG